MVPKLELIAEPVVVPSGVADQPLSDEETLTGAFSAVAGVVTCNISFTDGSSATS